MKNTLALLAVCTGLIALPASALAADTMMKASPSPMAMHATMMCRPAMAGEKATAMMGTEGIVCKTLPKMAPGKMMGPGTKADSAAAEDAAWQKWLSEMMAVPSSGGVGG
jgi:hypothetical protein